MALAPESNIYLETYGAVYVPIAKVASSSIKACLASCLQLAGAAGNPHEIAFPRAEFFTPAGERLYPGAYSFAFVRNPWSRLVSCYRDKIRGEVRDFTEFAESGVAHCLAGFDVFSAGMSFERFVRSVASIPDRDADEHFRSQADYVVNSSGVVALDFIGRYEKLQHDFAQIALNIGLPLAPALPHLQAAPARHVADFYSAETRGIVGRRYARDIELFAYRFPSD
jgi:hypothetical protein